MESAVRAVESSKLDKTVADADGLYSSTDGKVQDEKTREALKQAIAKRDADAIAKAVKAVNDSKAAKDRADAEAAAKAQAEQGGRGPGGRRTAGPTAGAGATLVLVRFVFVRRLVRFRRWTVLFRRIVFRRLPGRLFLKRGLFLVFCL